MVLIASPVERHELHVDGRDDGVDFCLQSPDSMMVKPSICRVTSMRDLVSAIVRVESAHVEVRLFDSLRSDEEPIETVVNLEAMASHSLLDW